MQKNFKQDSLEEFLQNQLQNHRMYPKDTVWREIRLKLHGEKRWPALTIAAVMLIGITTAICLHFSSRQNIFSIKPALQPNTTAMAIAHNKPATGSQGFSLSLNDNAPAFDDNVNNIQTAVNSNNDNNKSTDELITSATTPGEENEIFINDELNHLIVENNKTIITSESPSELRNYKSAIEIIPGASVASAGLKLAIAQSATMQNDIKNATPAEIDDANNSLIDKFKELRKPGKFSMMLYAAPSISYRKLVEDNTAIKSANEVARSSAPSFSNNRDVNDAVRHKPSSGIEAGVSILYDFTKKFRLKGGLQFNMRQYSIDAYKSNTELSSIALVDDNGVDTINTFSLYRNYGNNSSAELMNRYYQVSVPVGIEWEVFGNKRFQFNVAGSIQPTYLLNRNAYMLTTNFKNYAENEDLVRKWNINSNIEAFITMNIGEFKWQLGPQIRYQPYSTFIGKYPIKEHLIDYGIKLGFSTRLR